MFQQTTFFVLLTYNTVEISVLSQVSDESHHVPLHVDFVGPQKGTDDGQAIQSLHNGLAHYAGDLGKRKIT